MAVSGDLHGLKILKFINEVTLEKNHFYAKKVAIKHSQIQVIEPSMNKHTKTR